MLIVHDLVEVIAGDIPAFTKAKMSRQRLQNRESKALKQLTKTLPARTRKEIISLWQEYAARKTPEGKLAYAIDKIEAPIQHNIADISTWEQGDYDYQPYFRDNLYGFDEYVRKLKDQVDHDTMKKIEKAGKLHRVSKKAAARYKKILEEK